MKLRKKRDLKFYRIVPLHHFKSHSPNYVHVFVQSLAALGLPRRLEWLQGSLPFRFIVTKTAHGVSECRTLAHCVSKARFILPTRTCISLNLLHHPTQNWLWMAPRW
ncbi:hypothetical protein [Ferroacidibacillus organovorans]|uniref:Uncharacterized protein n=1 Tax=Ferroacidibacillus organovorans TaxID=1765683 RepID=A0A101XRD5_9BACL|nr:hypothetical protein [Ferroacidibacillus organovorans]KUO96116.1 hypothetical protein ATW55_14380 [Ferroacidibacillus organovorans]